MPLTFKNVRFVVNYSELLVMQKAFHIRTKVLPGCKIELVVPQIEKGSEVEIFIIASEISRPSKSALEIIRDLKGHRLFQFPEEVDRYLKHERDAWDR